MRTASSIEQANSASSEQAPKKAAHGKHPNSRKNLVAPWKKGESGNPSGKPGFDVAAYLCRKAIEQNQEEIYKGLSARLIAGEPYLLQVASDRGYGKLKEVREVTHVNQDIPDTDLQARIDSILRDIGLARAVDEAGGTEIAPGRTEKANGKAKDTPVLP